jgi:hypothetical protein
MNRTMLGEVPKNAREHKIRTGMAVFCAGADSGATVSASPLHALTSP